MIALRGELNLAFAVVTTRKRITDKRYSRIGKVKFHLWIFRSCTDLLHGSQTSFGEVFRINNIVPKYSTFDEDYSILFSSVIVSKIKYHFTADQPTEANRQIQSLFASGIFNSLLANEEDYSKFIQAYKNSLIIVNPTKKKFSDTLLNKNDYDFLRIFSNKLEKENSFLVINGFSFRNEYILDLVKRSMINPSLKILIFTYQDTAIGEFKKLFGEAKNNHITFIALDGEKLSLNYFNYILSHIHS